MNITHFKGLALLLILNISLVSCLKHIDDLTVSGVVEFSEPSATGAEIVEREVMDMTKPEQFVLKVTITSVDTLHKDTKITLAIDNSLIDKYNSENKLTGNEAAVPVPVAALNISSFDITVPVGSIEADWTFTVDASKLSNLLNTFYVIPVKIISAENDIAPGSNYSHLLVRILARNEFDGKYMMKGFIMRTGDKYGLEGYFSDFPYSLFTVNGNEVKMDHVQQWANWTGVGDIDSGWSITINKTGSSSYPVTLVDLTQGADFTMVAGYPSRYDVASRTFFWSVEWGDAIPKNRGCTDTLVYVGPR